MNNKLRGYSCSKNDFTDKRAALLYSNLDVINCFFLVTATSESNKIDTDPFSFIQSVVRVVALRGERRCRRREREGDGDANYASHRKTGPDVLTPVNIAKPETTSSQDRLH